MTSVENVYPPSFVTCTTTFPGLTKAEAGLRQMMRVADTKLGFTRLPLLPHLQNVCADTKVKDPVRLLPIIVTGVPPEEGPRPGSICAIRHGANRCAWLMDICADCNSSNHPHMRGIDIRRAARFFPSRLTSLVELEGSDSMQVVKASRASSSRIVAVSREVKEISECIRWDKEEAPV